MRTFDLAPLYRSTVGFDRLFSMLDTGFDAAPGYPPYNIERTGENAYRISVAVAGFGEDDLSIEAKENTLTIKGDKAAKDEKPSGEVLYQGIAARAFERVLPACRLCPGQGRDPRERTSARRSRARDSRGEEAAPDPDRYGSGQGRRSQGCLNYGCLNYGCLNHGCLIKAAKSRLPQSGCLSQRLDRIDRRERPGISGALSISRASREQMRAWSGVPYERETAASPRPHSCCSMPCHAGLVATVLEKSLAFAPWLAGGAPGAATSEAGERAAASLGRGRGSGGAPDCTAKLDGARPRPGAIGSPAGLRAFKAGFTGGPSASNGTAGLAGPSDSWSGMRPGAERMTAAGRHSSTRAPVRP